MKPNIAVARILVQDLGESILGHDMSSILGAVSSDARQRIAELHVGDRLIEDSVGLAVYLYRDKQRARQYAGGKRAAA